MTAGAINAEEGPGKCRCLTGVNGHGRVAYPQGARSDQFTLHDGSAAPGNHVSQWFTRPLHPGYRLQLFQLLFKPAIQLTPFGQSAAICGDGELDETQAVCGCSQPGPAIGQTAHAAGGSGQWPCRSCSRETVSGPRNWLVPSRGSAAAGIHEKAAVQNFRFAAGVSR